MIRLKTMIRSFSIAVALWLSALCCISCQHEALAQRIVPRFQQRPSVDWRVETLTGVLRTSSPNRVYAASSRDGSIAVLSPDGENGELRIIQRLLGPTTKDDQGGPVLATDLLDAASLGWLVCAPDGRHVYAGEVAFSTIIRFERDPTTGLLSPPEVRPEDRRAFQQVGETGWFLPPARLIVGQYLVMSSAHAVFEPTGRFLYVASAIGTVAVFDREEESGALTFRRVYADDKLVHPAKQAFEKVNWDELAVTWVKGLGRPSQLLIPAGSRPVYAVSHVTGEPGAILRFERNPATGLLYFQGAEGGPGNASYALPFSAIANRGGDQMILGMRPNGAVVLQRESKHGKLSESSRLPVPPSAEGDERGIESVAFLQNDRYLIALSCRQRKLHLFVPKADAKSFDLAASFELTLPEWAKDPVSDFQGHLSPGFADNEFYVCLPTLDQVTAYRIEQ